jgi:methionyl-tRNA formyltransferase
MGSSAASATCLHAIMREGELSVVGVVTQPDRPVGRGKVITPCPCKASAIEHGITEIITPENVNAPEAMAQIRAWKPDVIAVVAFGQFLKKPLLDLPLFGCINCHFSLLPKYRGASPVVAALAAGDKLTGVSVMRMGVGMDDGPVLLQSYEPIYSDVTGGELMGIFSADPKNEDQYGSDRCHAFEGRALLVVRTNTPGTVTVSVGSAGLLSGSATVEAK